MAISNEAFTEACIQVRKEFLGNRPKLKGLNHDPRFSLMPVFSKIASKHLYYRVVNNKKYFAAKHIHRLAQILDVPLNEITTI